MQYTTFGKTDEKVSILGMGGMRFDKHLTENDAVKLICYAHEKGVNYFDTAPAYNQDRSEAIYGKALKQLPRDSFFIATKGQNGKNATEITNSIERSLKRLSVEQIDFYFLWCIIYPEQYEKARQEAQALEAIFKAKERGLIKHIGVSSHMYSENVKNMIDDQIFEFVMLPYNALNFAAREDAIRYAKQKNIGTVVMNPVYGGAIADFKDIIKIYPDSNKSPVEDALRFCLDSRFIDITLAGMNSKEMIDNDINYAKQAQKITEQELNHRQKRIKDAFSDMCTSCGYCLAHCQENINIKSYMEVYNTYILTKNMQTTRERHKWYRNFGPLLHTPEASTCTQCRNCEQECTQYLDIVERLEWIAKHLESNEQN